MARARGPAQASSGASRAGQVSFAGSRARSSGAFPAVWGARDAGRCVSGARGAPSSSSSSSASSRQRRGCPGPAGCKEQGSSKPAVARAPAHRPGTPSDRAGPAGASPQTAARARSPPERRRSRTAGRAGLRAAEAAQAAGPGPGFPELPGPGRRVSRRGRRARGAGGAARGPSPCKAAALPAGARRRYRRAPPQSRAPRASSPFRARYAAAILFTSSPALHRLSAARPPRARPSRRRRARPLAEPTSPVPSANPAATAHWAIWTQAGPGAGIGSRSAPPQGWLLLAHWSADTPVKWRGREASAGR